MNPLPAVVLFPHSDDLLAAAARRIVAQADTLPNLSGSVVLLPDLLFATALRRHLLEAAQARGHTALLGPVISTLEQWLAEQVPLEKPVPGRARRELMLVEAIQQHPDVFGDQDPWTLANSLITLFDELTLHRVPIDAGLDDFRRRLQSAYGLAGTPPEPFDREARIVQRLWQAWHVQLQAGDLLDPAAALLQQLAMLSDRPPAQSVCLVGIDTPTGAEAEWIDSVLADGKGQLLLHRPMSSTATGHSAWQGLLAGATPADSPEQAAGITLDRIFDTSGDSLQIRTDNARTEHPEAPLAGRLHSFAAGSAEQEARAIDLQVRQWLLDGHQPVAVVTEDRRLGRRVRALLERAGVSLQDPGGWALSTTRAAAALERWLQSVEEDFAHEPLLDTLKSPFTLPEEDRDTLDNCVFRFETDIVRRENVARSLQRYRHHINARLEHYENRWSKETAAQLHQLLNQLDHAADPLYDCLRDKHPPALLLERLLASLSKLGMWQAFSHDPAGQRIQQEWRLLHDAARGSELQMDWSTFRAWLGSALERHDFRPANNHSPVLLLTLQQARLGRFAGVVIGACDSEHLPPAPAHSPFFNDRVRSELGLPAWPERQRQQQQHFRTLLESAPRVLLTWHREQDGEARTPSPWLARIEVFHKLAWDHDLQNTRLAAMLDHPGTRVCGHHPLPAPRSTRQPRAQLPAAAIPGELSVSAHGTLIDCPYRFYAASGLRLKAREEVKLALEKAEYGELVHRVLEVFHQGKDGYPAPLAQPVTRAQRDSATRQLEQVSRQVFERELEDNFEHRAWLRRWLVLVGPYIDWLIEQQAEWRFIAGERRAERRLAGGQLFVGRIDRIDQGSAGNLISDYKTGSVPGQIEVDSGEAVQLPSYVLLEEHAPAAAQYVQIGRINNRNTVRTGSRLDGTALAALSQAVLVRLETMLDEITAGTPLPAWGDEDTCRYCEMDGLCRKQAWPDS
jgi:ATP-dependent helicase/nuclease subunit B